MSRKRPALAAGRPPRRRSTGLAALVLMLAGLAALALWRWSQAGPASRPNVLLVTIDTLRADRLGCYGWKGATSPTLDALAREGARFPTAVMHAPLTSPSHASILTGLLPPHHGVRDNGAFVLPEQLPTLAEAFGRAGYRTAAFVSGFPLERRFGFGRGFEEYDDRLPRGDDRRRVDYVERHADRTTAAALAWLAGLPAVAAAGTQPWFAWIHYFDPHAPYEPPAEFQQRAGGAYEGELAFVDSELGRLLAGLSARGMRERTLVLVTSDHGESLGEHGELTHGVFVYDSTLRVPFLLAGPGVPSGREPGVVARGVDVLPTLLDLAGLGVPTGLDGRSLRGALRGETLADAPAYAEALFCARHLGWAPLFAWRTAQHKLIDAPEPELYALTDDVAEEHNRQAQQRALVERLRRDLRSLLTRSATTAKAAEGDLDSAERLRALGYLGGPAGAAPRPTGRDPKTGIALVNRLEQALTLLRSDPREAERLLSEVLREDPDMHMAWRSRALARNQAGRSAEALEDVRALERLGPLDGDDLELRADTLRLLGRYDEALQSVHEAARRQPRSPSPQLLAARIYRLQEQLQLAAQAFEAALRLDSESPEALKGLGEIAAARGDSAGAEAYLRRALERDADDAATLLRYGLVLARHGQAEPALTLFERALTREPANAEMRLALAAALARVGRPAEAVPHFEQALAAGHRSTALLNGLGFARLEAGDQRGGLEALRESLALDPRQADVRGTVASLRKGE